MKIKTHMFYNKGLNKQFGIDRIEPEIIDGLLSEDKVIYVITRDIILSKIDPHDEDKYNYVYNQLLHFRIVTTYHRWEHERNKELLKIF